MYCVENSCVILLRCFYFEPRLSYFIVISIFYFIVYIADLIIITFQLERRVFVGTNIVGGNYTEVR